MVDWIWANWVLGFLGYTGVIVRSQSCQVAALFQYFNIIYKGIYDSLIMIGYSIMRI